VYICSREVLPLARRAAAGAHRSGRHAVSMAHGKVQYIRTDDEANGWQYWYLQKYYQYMNIQYEVAE
jgi:hypothetical protein